MLNYTVEDVDSKSQSTPNDLNPNDSFQLEEAIEILDKKIYTRAEKKESIIKLLHRATSSGDAETVTALLAYEPLSDFIDVNAKDEEGSSPLIYAACFGYIEVAKALVAGKADVNLQDKNGWPPLMWAMNNKHEGIVKILLENGASPSTKNSKGRTVLDIINHGLSNTNQNEKSAKLQEILSYNPSRQNHQSVASYSSYSFTDYGEDDTNSLSSWAYTDPEGQERELFKANQERQSQLEQLGNELDDLMNSENYGFNEDSLNELTNEEFVWDQCLPDQMFVFSAQHIPHIIGTVITTMVPQYTKDQKSVPANVLFLCSRFALNFSTPDLLEDLLKGGLKAISDCVKGHHNDIKYQVFWLANCSQLLYYLKKDCGLVEATVEQQLALSELIHEIYQILVRETQTKILAELESSILECDSIPGLSDESKFKDKRKSFFSFAGIGGDEEKTNVAPGKSSLRKRLSLRRKPTASHVFSRKRVSNPETITDILSKAISMLQMYQVHPILIHHFLNQLIYFITSELFNRILDTRNYCSRTRAMQIRMNVTVLEDWIRRKSSSPILSNITFHFKSLLHLLQLLQCFSAHRSLPEFLETLQTLDTLTPLQIQLMAETYRYENDEVPVVEEITQYINETADEVLERKNRSFNAVKNGKNIVVVRDLDAEVSTRISRRVSFLDPGASPASCSRSPSPSKESASISQSSSDSDISKPSEPPQYKGQPKLPVPSSYHMSSDSTSSENNNSNTGPKADSESKLKPFFQYSEFTVFKDPNHLLPFSVPTQSDMTNGWLLTVDIPGSPGIGPRDPSVSPGSPKDLATQMNDLYIPSIPESVVGMLDVNNVAS